MRFLVIGITLSMLFAGALFAQEDAAAEADQVPTGWNLSAVFNLTHNQSAYSVNWDGDENGQLSWLSQLAFVAEKDLSSLLQSRSTLDLQYGQTQTQDRDMDNWTQPFKNADRIDLESVLRFTLHGWADPYVSGRFQSQFTDRRTGEIDWINPMTFTESAGLAKTLLADPEIDQKWLLRLGGSVQQYIDRNYLVDDELGLRGEKRATYAGVELVSELISPFWKDNIRIDSRLTIFQALYNSDADDLKGQPNEDYWQSPDIDLETIFTANITKVLMVNLTTRLLYDKEIAKGGRFKETLALGITYVLI